MAEIKYRAATLEDYDAIKEFLRVYFFEDEPLTNSYKPVEANTHHEEANMTSLSDGLSFMAFSGDQIVGVNLCLPKYPNNENKLREKAAQIPNTKYGNILLLLADCEKASNVFERYNVDKVMHGMATAVHKDFRGRGIGLKLLENIMRRSKELGFQMYSLDCSSVYSAQFCERMNMDCVNVYPYADFREPKSDAQVFFPTGIHQLLKTYAMKLE